MPHMPDTPPEKRRATKGSVTRRLPVLLTDVEDAALAKLCERWQCSESEAVRRAIREAAKR